MSRHTAKPWIVSIGEPADAPAMTTIVARERELLIGKTFCRREYGPSREEAEANARLMAAAPRLAEELADLLYLCESRELFPNACKLAEEALIEAGIEIDHER